VRVLALCDYYSPDSIGGAERVAREVYEYLAEHCDCEILVLSGMPRKRRNDRRVESSEVNVVHVDGIDVSKVLKAQLLFVPNFRSIIRRHIREFRPDVIHANGLHFHGSFIGARESKRAGVPLVSTAHLADVDALPLVSRVLAKIFNGVVSRLIARSSLIVIAVSSSVQLHLRSLGISPDRIRIVPNGVDHSRFRPPASYVEHTTLQAILVGRLISNKGSLDALEGIATARQEGGDVRLKILGDGPLAEKVRARSQMSDLRGSVEMIGTVANVEAYMREADVLLRPSWTEGLPLAIIEALACGTPVICSDVPGNTDLVEDGYNGLIYPVGDIEALTDRILRLCNDRELRTTLARAALESSQAYTWEKCAEGHHRAFLDAALRNE
jgi:glycosyltransferase involved in cell wall biosynthesis